MSVLHLPVQPPFAWPQLLAFMAGRGAAGVEAASGLHYRRTVALHGHLGWLSATPSSATQITVELSADLAPVQHEIAARLAVLFNTQAPAAAIDAHLAQQPLLAPLVAAVPGLRVPGTFDGFELILRAILGQQVSVKAATTLFSRFAARFGQPLSTPWPELTHTAPTASAVAQASLQQLIDLGLTTRRAACVQGIAAAMASGTLQLNPQQPPETTIAQLLAYPGIGPWTAHYTAMRALGWADAWPDGDLGLYKATNTRNPKALRAAGEAFSPYRAYAALRLWQQGHSGG